MTNEVEAHLSDIDFEQTEPDSDDEALPASQYEIFSYPADTTLKGYLEQWNNNQLSIPDFQREYVWDQTRASKLIESFLLGLPVPPVFLYKPAGSKSFWIIDGHQRIRSIVDYQKGIFGESKFRLKGVDDRWLGRTFEELPEDARFNLETTVLRAVVIQQTHPADHSSIFHIFERLNTGGIRLNAMEVRQCVYASEYLNRLKQLNLMKSWRDILGVDKADKRLRDKELILRVMSFYKDLEAYDKPMKRFLNDCAVHFTAAKGGQGQAKTDEMSEMASKFSMACDLILAELGSKPFHLRGRLNFSALDAVVATLMRAGDVSDLKAKFQNLVADKQFQDDVSFNTSDQVVVNRRFEAAKKYLVS
ncbi:DUF262 domain-containing protein [Aminobacter sp. LjRoot7]|uniref:DUF262 domain-containing protein n=1 Tax=Aminobacter sp. LjRoot7 TaxID=3342335 RepID=UPI003ECD4149